MITMEILGRIKRLYFRDKKSLHEIARLTGLSRNTIRSWVREPQAEEALKYVRQDMPGKLNAYHVEIEQALKADSHRTKQNRRTAKALLTQIRASGYTGGYSQLTAFVREWRGKGGKALKAFVPLLFELGEAFQFDWSDEGMVVGGIYYKLQVAHLKLCASRAFWLVAYPSQGHEMLFEAHTGSYRNALAIDMHVDVHIGVGAQHAASVIALDQSQFGQHLNIFVDTLDVAADLPGKLAHRHGALPLQGRNQGPATFGEPAKEGSRTLEVQRLALVSVGLSSLARAPHGGTPIGR